MSRIKSAWELALEKTKDMDFDEEKLRKDQLKKDGMALAGRYLSNVDMPYDEMVQKLGAVKKEDAELFRSGMAEVVVSNIVLPQDELFVMRFERLSDVARALDPASGDLVGQLKSFLEGYLQERENFIINIRQQIQDQVDPTQYTQVIQQNLKRLDAKYQETLDTTKQQLWKNFTTQSRI